MLPLWPSGTPLKTVLGSVLMGWKYKPGEFAPEEYAAYGVAEIVNTMGIKKKVRVYATPNPWIAGPYTNATNNKVYLPLKWMNRFPRLDMRGVLGHEIGHIKTKGKFLHDFVAGIGGIAGVAFLLGMYSVSLITVMIFEFALAFLVLTVLSWRNERRADLEGAKITGPEGLISVFQQLKAEGRKDDPSETHPSLSDRIARLSLLLDRSPDVRVV
jgi:Zn-dependent protease with chaperone function